MVPPDSHGISRAPCYLGVSQTSRTGFGYGGLTLCAGPFAGPSPTRTVSKLVPRPADREQRDPTTPYTQPLPGLARIRFGLVRFRSPLLPESRLFSLPAGTEMFHFPAFPPLAVCVRARVTVHDDCRVSPFGHPRITAWLTAPRGLSWPPTSFVGSWCQGIHRVPLKTWLQMLASTVQFSNNDRSPVTHSLGGAVPGPVPKEAGAQARALRYPTACPARSRGPEQRSTPRGGSTSVWSVLDRAE